MYYYVYLFLLTTLKKIVSIDEYQYNILIVNIVNGAMRFVYVSLRFFLVVFLLLIQKNYNSLQPNI